MKYIAATRENVKQIGRSSLIDDTLWCALSGTGIEFDFTGRKLAVTLVGDVCASTDDPSRKARAAVYLNGQRVYDVILDSAEKTFTLIDGSEVVSANVTVIKLSESAMSTMGIAPIAADDNALIAAAAEKAHSIEFIGDSITCGYGIDDEDISHQFSTATEDVTKTYAYKTAGLLGADYSIFSVSGYGIISGYTEDDQKIAYKTIPQYYGSCGFSDNAFAGKVFPQDIGWDNSLFDPELVVINLGTNDDSYCKDDPARQDEFSREYAAFLKKVRTADPRSHIICSVGIMGQRIYSAVERATELYAHETNDKNISCFKFDEQLPEDGIAVDYHPSEKTHDKAAAALAGYIKARLGW